MGFCIKRSVLWKLMGFGSHVAPSASYLQHIISMILCLCDDHLRWSKAVARRAFSQAVRDARTNSDGNGSPKIPPWERGESANHEDVLVQFSGTILQHENMDCKIGTSQTSHTHAIKLWGSEAKNKLSCEDATGWLATSQLQNRYMMMMDDGLEARSLLLFHLVAD